MLLGAGILSVQVGAGIAARMFGTVSAAGMTGLRLWAATLVLIGLGARPTVRALRGVIADRAWRDAAVVAAFGVTLGLMNFSIYQSFARIPLGIAVTIEFLGPLGVAIATSRRPSTCCGWRWPARGGAARLRRHRRGQGRRPDRAALGTPSLSG